MHSIRDCFSINETMSPHGSHRIRKTSGQPVRLPHRFRPLPFSLVPVAFSIDLAQGSLDRGKRTFARNGLNEEGRGKFIAEDVRSWLARKNRKREREGKSGVVGILLSAILRYLRGADVFSPWKKSGWIWRKAFRPFWRGTVRRFFVITIRRALQKSIKHNWKNASLMFTE